MVQRLLTARGTVNIDKRTNTLIIKDIASVIDEATALIKAIDTQTPQVMIESKIVEATLDFAREFGVTWGFGVNPLTTDQIGSDAFHLNPTTTGQQRAVHQPGRRGRTSLYNLGAFILDEKLNLNLQLQAAESTGDGKVISSPRLVTLDNSPAKIEQGVSIPFQTFENGDAQLEFVDAVLSLNVTPHITADRSIIMKVKVSRNAPDEQRRHAHGLARDREEPGRHRDAREGRPDPGDRRHLRGRHLAEAGRGCRTCTRSRCSARCSAATRSSTSARSC